MHLETVINFRDDGAEFASPSHNIEIGEASLLVSSLFLTKMEMTRGGKILKGKSRETGRRVPVTFAIP